MKSRNKDESSNSLPTVLCISILIGIFTISMLLIFVPFIFSEINLTWNQFDEEVEEVTKLNNALTSDLKTFPINRKTSEIIRERIKRGEYEVPDMPKHEKKFLQKSSEKTGKGKENELKPRKKKLCPLPTESTDCPRGEQGPRGLRGEDGQQGIEGKDGKDGHNSENVVMNPPQSPCVLCPPGEQGTPGLPGIQGTRGMRGAQGREGQGGANGTPGSTGDMGEMGKEGEIGPNGVQGLPGVDGVKGLGRPGQKGPIGQMGQKGPKGIPGRDNNNIGSPGYTGRRGRPGRRGPMGQIGRPGQPGVVGIRGSEGECNCTVQIHSNGNEENSEELRTHLEELKKNPNQMRRFPPPRLIKIDGGTDERKVGMDLLSPFKSISEIVEAAKEKVRGEGETRSKLKTSNESVPSPSVPIDTIDSTRPSLPKIDKFAITEKKERNAVKTPVFYRTRTKQRGHFIDSTLNVLPHPSHTDTVYSVSQTDRKPLPTTHLPQFIFAATVTPTLIPDSDLTSTTTVSDGLQTPLPTWAPEESRINRQLTSGGLLKKRKKRMTEGEENRQKKDEKMEEVEKFIAKRENDRVFYRREEDDFPSVEEPRLYPQSGVVNIGEMRGQKERVIREKENEERREMEQLRSALLNDGDYRMLKSLLRSGDSSNSILHNNPMSNISPISSSHIQSIPIDSPSIDNDPFAFANERTIAHVPMTKGPPIAHVPQLDSNSVDDTVSSEHHKRPIVNFVWPKTKQGEMRRPRQNGAKILSGDAKTMDNSVIEEAVQAAITAQEKSMEEFENDQHKGETTTMKTSPHIHDMVEVTAAHDPTIGITTDESAVLNRKNEVEEYEDITQSSAESLDSTTPSSDSRKGSEEPEDRGVVPIMDSDTMQSVASSENDIQAMRTEEEEIKLQTTSTSTPDVVEPEVTIKVPTTPEGEDENKVQTTTLMTTEEPYVTIRIPSSKSMEEMESELSSIVLDSDSVVTFPEDSQIASSSTPIYSRELPNFGGEQWIPRENNDDYGTTEVPNRMENSEEQPNRTTNSIEVLDLGTTVAMPSNGDTVEDYDAITVSPTTTNSNVHEYERVTVPPETPKQSGMNGGEVNDSETTTVPMESRPVFRNQIGRGERHESPRNVINSEERVQLAQGQRMDFNFGSDEKTPEIDPFVTPVEKEKSMSSRGPEVSVFPSEIINSGVITRSIANENQFRTRSEGGFKRRKRMRKGKKIRKITTAEQPVISNQNEENINQYRKPTGNDIWESTVISHDLLNTQQQLTEPSEDTSSIGEPIVFVLEDKVREHSGEPNNHKKQRRGEWKRKNEEEKREVIEDSEAIPTTTVVSPLDSNSIMDDSALIDGHTINRKKLEKMENSMERLDEQLRRYIEEFERSHTREKVVEDMNVLNAPFQSTLFNTEPAQETPPKRRRKKGRKMNKLQIKEPLYQPRTPIQVEPSMEKKKRKGMKIRGKGRRVPHFDISEGRVQTVDGGTAETQRKIGSDFLLPSLAMNPMLPIGMRGRGIRESKYERNENEDGNQLNNGPQIMFPTVINKENIKEENNQTPDGRESRRLKVLTLPTRLIMGPQGVLRKRLVRGEQLVDESTSAQGNYWSTSK